MKAARWLAIALAGTAMSASAQMQGGHTGMTGQQHPEMSAQQSQQMMGSQMMTQQMMRDMAGMTRQMIDQMQRMRQVMDAGGPQDAQAQQRMSRVMDEMSATMHEMASGMAHGQVSPEAMRSMQQHMRDMEQMLTQMGGSEPARKP